jgi:hypothetical protein
MPASRSSRATGTGWLPRPGIEGRDRYRPATTGRGQGVERSRMSWALTLRSCRAVQVISSLTA